MYLRELIAMVVPLPRMSIVQGIIQSRLPVLRLTDADAFGQTEDERRMTAPASVLRHPSQLLNVLGQITS